MALLGGYKNILPSMLTILPSSSTRAILLTSPAIYSCIPPQGHPILYNYIFETDDTSIARLNTGSSLRGIGKLFDSQCQQIAVCVNYIVLAVSEFTIDYLESIDISNRLRGVHDVSYTTRFVHPTFRIQIIKNCNVSYTSFVKYRIYVAIVNEIVC